MGLLMLFESIHCDAVKLLEDMCKQQDRLLQVLKDLVELESPSHNKMAVDRCVDRVEKECTRIGGRVRRHRRKGFGDLLEVRFGRSWRDVKPVMLLGHL